MLMPLFLWLQQESLVPSAECRVRSSEYCFFDFYSAFRTPNSPLHLKIFQPLRIIRRGEGLDKFIEVAAEHGFEPVERKPDAVIRHPALREIIRPDLFASLAGAHLRPAVLGGLGLL